MTIRIEVDQATHDRLEALGRGLPAGDVVRTLSYASGKVLRQLDLRRVMSEERERAGRRV